MRVPVLDMKREEFSTSRTAVVVFGFLFAWAETETRQQWVPEKYFQYTHQGTFPQPEDWDDYMVPGYPMAF